VDISESFGEAHNLALTAFIALVAFILAETASWDGRYALVTAYALLVAIK